MALTAEQTLSDCSVTPLQRAIASLRAKGYCAIVMWTAEDIQNDFVEDWTLEQCQQWLDENQDSIENEMIECGREVISQLLHG